MKYPERLLLIREFLNSEEDGGSAFVKAMVEAPNLDKDIAWLDSACGILEISDCNRKAQLTFTLHDPSSRRNSMRKMRTLYKIVDRFDYALYQAYRLQIQASWDDRKKKRADKADGTSALDEAGA